MRSPPSALSHRHTPSPTLVQKRVLEQVIADARLDIPLLACHSACEDRTIAGYTTTLTLGEV